MISHLHFSDELKQVLAGVTQVSVSLAVIVLELTGELSLLLPVMIAILLAKTIINAFGTPSIYDSYIHMKRYPYLVHEAQIDHALVNATDVMRKNVSSRCTSLCIHRCDGFSSDFFGRGCCCSIVLRYSLCHRAVSQLACWRRFSQRTKFKGFRSSQQRKVGYFMAT